MPDIIKFCVYVTRTNGDKTAGFFEVADEATARAAAIVKFGGRVTVVRNCGPVRSVGS